MLLVANEANSQPQDEPRVLYLSPNDYTDLLIGDYEFPPGYALARLKSDSEASSQELRNSQIVIDANSPRSILGPNVSEIPPLEGVEADALGIQMYLKIIEHDIKTLGTSNVSRLVANGFGMSQEDASDFVNFIQEVSVEFEARIADAKVKNCEEFISDLNSTTTRRALENIAWADRQLSSVTIDYFSGIFEKLDSTVGSSVGDSIKGIVDLLKPNMKSYRVDALGILESSGVDPLEHYTSRCQVMLSVN